MGYYQLLIFAILATCQTYIVNSMSCAICQNPIFIEGITLPEDCIHRFCYPCIDAHLYFRNRCPVCRAGIKFLQRANPETGEALGRVELVPSPQHNAQTTPPPPSQHSESNVEAEVAAKRKLNFSAEETGKKRRRDDSSECSILNKSPVFSPSTPSPVQEVADLPQGYEDFRPMLSSTLKGNRDDFKLVCMYLGLSDNSETCA